MRRSHLILVALLAASVPGQNLFERFDRALTRPYVSGVPFMPTGNALWAAHPDGFGFSGGVHDDLWTEPGTLGYALRLTHEGIDLAVGQAISSLSRVELGAERGHLSVTGGKWISQDDAMVTELQLRNRGDQPLSVQVMAEFHFAATSFTGGVAEATLSRFQRRRHLWATAYPLDFRAEARPVADPSLVEGEAFVEQRGSQGEDRKRAASGGRLLGANFGGEADHFARFDLKSTAESTSLWVRYSRAYDSPAQWTVSVDGVAAPEPLKCPPTKGWGAREEEWAWAVVPLGKLEPGRRRIELRSSAARNNTNVDALALRDTKETTPPALPRPPGTLAAGEITVEPHSARLLRIAHGVANSAEAAQRSRERWQPTETPEVLTWPQQKRDTERWYLTHAPDFRCSDPEMERMYAHRVYLMRKNLKRLGQGALPEAGFAEGRWDSTWYPNVISYGAAHQIREARWLADPEIAEAALRGFAQNRKADQVFPSHITAEGPAGGQYTDWIASTVMDLWNLHGNSAFLKSVLPGLEANALGWYAVYDRDQDGLLLVDSHWWTGMEFQPSFFAFSNFDLKKDHHLERVDLSAYAAGNCRAVAQGLRIIGEVARAEVLEALADRTVKALTSQSWDADSRWFYSVHPDDSRRSPVREVIGVYPFYFGLPPKNGSFERAWSVLLDPQEFWTPWPVASCSQRCEVFGQGEWPGHGRVAACLWNGPTWPHANSLVLSAMGETLRSYPECALKPAHLWELFASFTKAQVSPTDPPFPFTGEYYRGDNRAWLTAERDYFHSTWIDVLFGDLMGIRPSPDGALVIHPLIPKETWSSWAVRGVQWRQHRLDLSWESNPPRFVILLDGQIVHEGNRLERVRYPR